MNIFLIAGHNLALQRETRIGSILCEPHGEDTGSVGRHEGRLMTEHHEAVKVLEVVKSRLEEIGVPRFKFAENIHKIPLFKNENLESFLNFKPNVTLLDERMNLHQKIRYLNHHAKKEDLVISLHFNACSDDTASGTETFYNTLSRRFSPARSFDVAKAVQRTLRARLGTKNRGVKPDTAAQHGRLGILRDSIPQNDCLVEIGFLRNKMDMEKIRDNGSEALWLAVCDGYRAALLNK